MNNIVHTFLTFFIAAGLHCTVANGQETKQNKSTLAFINATIYVSPTDPAILEGTVLTKDDKIIAIGKKNEVKLPENAKLIDCKGLTITAGFWNSHVHFTDPKIANAQNLSNSELSTYLEQFLIKYGFTYAFDIGSFPENTNNIRQRINNGSIRGPLILTTGLPLTAEDGTPFYVKAMNIKLPELTSVDVATKIVNQNIAAGLDGIKIFAGSPMGPGRAEKMMPIEIAKAVINTAHKKGKLVFAHPSINDGILVSLKSGIDILAHTTPDGGQAWDSQMIQQMVKKNLYLIPTLKLWKWSLLNNNQSPKQIEDFVSIAIGQVKDFNEAGGNLLFGTDIGFMDDFDPTDEYVYLQKAGLNFRQILAMLTTTASGKYGFSKQYGRLAVGMTADMVAFKGNPELDIRALADVKYTIRNGEMIFIK
jgi:imidazolonepropionase-like amidohydrolase